MKLNFDGSIKHNNMATLGFVIIDHYGYSLFAAAKNISQSEALIAKTLDLREGLLIVVKHYEHQRVIVKSNSKLLIDSVNGVCENIKAISIVFISIHFKTYNMYMEANFAVVIITEFGHDVFFHVFSIFHLNQLRGNCNREFAL